VNSSDNRPQSFISDYDSIYATNSREDLYNQENIWYNFNVLWLKDFENYVQLYDLFKWMINSDSNIRFYGKDCLNHQYFTGKLSGFSMGSEINQEGRFSLVSYESDNHFEAHYRNEMIECFKFINNYTPK